MPRRRARDHPRSRGEYQPRPIQITGNVGSSPLSRGIQQGDKPAVQPKRIIPALAGNTCWQAVVDAWNGGSSPLSRGILKPLSKLLRELWIIPALAGNTQFGRGLALSNRDHPRSRGEYSTLQARLVKSIGSSPLSRGILGETSEDAQAARIIPALAGNTTVSGLQCTAARDHPRSRGEYHLGIRANQKEAGSSPLSRGIRGW